MLMAFVSVSMASVTMTAADTCLAIFIWSMIAFLPSALVYSEHGTKTIFMPFAYRIVKRMRKTIRKRIGKSLQVLHWRINKWNPKNIRKTR
jgi:hypothetical protein